MKVRTPFWPLLKNELALSLAGSRGQFAGLLLVYWLVIGALPLLVMFGDNISRGNLAALFEAGFLPIIAFLFLNSLALWITYASVPAFSELLALGDSSSGTGQDRGSFEFLFTRAVDRGILCRARTATFFIFALTPLLLNVAVSPFAPALTFMPSDATSAETVNRQAQYLRAFPGIHPTTGQATIGPGKIIIPHGAVVYTAWLAWSGTLALLLLQGYSIWIARKVKPNNWWTAFFPAAPILLLLASLIMLARGSLKTHVSIYEQSFLLFATHPAAMVATLAVLAVVIQTWCERRFSKLEIL